MHIYILYTLQYIYINIIYTHIYRYMGFTPYFSFLDRDIGDHW